MLNLAQGFTGVDPLADQYAPWSPYNYVMGNPISLIDPNGREPSPARAERRRLRKSARALRKYEKHIGSVLRDELVSLVKTRKPQSRDDYRDIADIIQGKANTLLDANKTKGWARFYQPKRHFKRKKLGKSGKNGIGGRHIMTLKVWQESPTQEFDTDNSGANFTKTQTFAKGVENQFVAFAFDGDNFPDQLTVTSGSGNVLTSVTAGRTGASSQFANGLFSEKDGASITFRVTNGANGNNSNGDYWSLSITTFSLNLNSPLITGGKAYSN